MITFITDQADWYNKKAKKIKNTMADLQFEVLATAYGLKHKNRFEFLLDFAAFVIIRAKQSFKQLNTYTSGGFTQTSSAPEWMNVPKNESVYSHHERELEYSKHHNENLSNLLKDLNKKYGNK
jgi:hypothetical protein